jgi:hypothetical protein
LAFAPVVSRTRRSRCARPARASRSSDLKMTDILITSVNRAAPAIRPPRRSVGFSAPKSTWNTSRRRPTGRSMPDSISSDIRATRKASGGFPGAVSPRPATRGQVAPRPGSLAAIGRQFA